MRSLCALQLEPLWPLAEAHTYLLPAPFFAFKVSGNQIHLETIRLGLVMSRRCLLRCRTFVLKLSSDVSASMLIIESIQ